MKLTPDQTYFRLTAWALLAAGLGALGSLWFSWCEFPIYGWNEVRLAPAFAIRHGINPYPPLGGGPLTTWIYGPVGALLNLPATFAPTVTSALQVAAVINLLTVLGPPALIFLGTAEVRARGRLAGGLALAVATLFVPRTDLMLQVADHAAIAFGLLSNWWLTRRESPGVAHLAGAAALGVLAIWSKQISVFLVPAQLAFLLLAGQRPAALRYLALVAVLGLLALGIFSLWFGFSNLWLNLVAIPGSLPAAELLPRLALRPWNLLAQLLLPAIALGVLWRRRWWPDRTRESGRFFQLSVLAFAAMMPIGLAGYFKIGGDINLLHSWHYLMPGLIVAWLAQDRPSHAAALRVLAIVAAGLALRARDLVALPAQPFAGHFAAAEPLLAAHPHRLWFPQNPLITFYADHRLWHSEDGVLTRYIAGLGLREPDFRRHLPPNLEGVVYPAIIEFPFALPLLPEFNRAEKVRYWTLHIRASDAAPSAPLPAPGRSPDPERAGPPGTR